MQFIAASVLVYFWVTLTENFAIITQTRRIRFLLGIVLPPGSWSSWYESE